MGGRKYTENNRTDRHITEFFSQVTDRQITEKKNNTNRQITDRQVEELKKLRTVI